MVSCRVLGEQGKILLAEYSNENLLAVKELVEQGVIRAVIDRRYPVEEIVGAHWYVETSQKKGNIILTMPA